MIIVNIVVRTMLLLKSAHLPANAPSLAGGRLQVPELRPNQTVAQGNAAVPAQRWDLVDLGVGAAPVQRIPWYLWCLAAAVSCYSLGIYWDISWHISIGRDTFWTPAHMMIYAAGVLAGISCGYAILNTTFGASEQAKNSTVSIWGFRGPLGCFIATWGAFAMLSSALFDNWWHAAYGLDVKIVSLPHSILATGGVMITLGAILLVCAHMNRACGQYRDKLDRLRLLLGGLGRSSAGRSSCWNQRRWNSCITCASTMLYRLDFRSR